MSNPTVRIPEPQQLAFRQSVAKRLGLDLSIIEEHSFDVGFEVVGDEGKLSVSLVAHLPAGEIRAMFNDAQEARAT